MKSIKQQRGVSLVEVLVTLILISIGLLGTASLQILSKRSNFEAAQRTTAAHFANDLFQRMRSNREALVTYLNADGAGDADPGTAPSKDCGSDAGSCNSIELANFDISDWEQQIVGVQSAEDGLLLEPSVCVDGPVGGGTGLYEVAIAWRGQAEHTNPTVHACGDDTAKYGANNEFRHVLVMQTYITVD